MSYAIIGFGKIGQALAKAFARKGIGVSVATTRLFEDVGPMSCRSTSRHQTWPR
jgi:predicted dinucleotide-binding enzyme